MGVVAKRCDDEKGYVCVMMREVRAREGGSIAAESDENKGVEVVVKSKIAVAHKRWLGSLFSASYYSNPHMARMTAFDPSSAFTSPTYPSFPLPTVAIATAVSPVLLALVGGKTAD